MGWKLVRTSRYSNTRIIHKLCYMAANGCSTTAPALPKIGQATTDSDWQDSIVPGLGVVTLTIGTHVAAPSSKPRYHDALIGVVCGIQPLAMDVCIV